MMEDTHSYRVSSPSVQAETNRFRFVQWDITSACNLRCRHCRSESFYGDGSLERNLPLADVKAKIDDLERRGVRRIHFLGGEPFVRKDMDEIVSYASSRDILCSINTNGTLITDDVAERIIRAGVFLLTFSLDGPDSESHDAIRGAGSFVRTMRGIERVRRARSRWGVPTRCICSTVLMRPNVHKIAEMVDLCTNNGLQNLIVTGLRRMGGAEQAFAELRVTEEERLNAAESLAGRMAGSGVRCNVQIECANLLEKAYLGAKYGVDLAIGRSGCSAIIGKGFVQASGTFYPCQEVAKAAKAGLNGHKESSEAGWEDYGDFARAVADRKTYASYKPCNTCPALGRLCVPCPLAGMRGGEYVNGRCSSIMNRARAEAVDLGAVLNCAFLRAPAERVVQDPGYRRSFFGSAVEVWLERENVDVETAKALREVHRDVLEEVRAILRASVSNTESSDN